MTRVARSSRLWRLGLLLVLGVYALTALVQSLTLPVFEGPDEQRHYAYARYLVNEQALPPVHRDQNDNTFTYDIGQESGQPPLYYVLVAFVTAPFPGADNVAPFVQPNPFMTAYDTAAIAGDNHNRYLHGPERNTPLQGLSLAVHMGRLVSIVLGLLTLLGVYGAGRAVSPSQPAVALLATALVACQPVFVFLSSAITNDTAVICFAALSTWIALKIAREGATVRLAVLGGLFAGLAVLSKFNGVWIAAVVWLAIFAALMVQPAATRRRNLVPLAASVVAWGLVVGWWFIRNYFVAGDPFGLAIHALGDQSPVTLGKSALVDFGLRLAELESGVWFWSGWAGLVPGPDYLFTIGRLLFGVGALGSICAAAQALIAGWPTRRLDAPAVIQAACLVLCVLLAILGAIYWILIYMWSLGRLMFPALASAAVIAATGWVWWLGKLWRARLPVAARWLASAAFIAALLSASFGAVATTTTALGVNPGIAPVDARVTRTQLTFLEPGNAGTPVASVIGYDVPVQDIGPGDVLFARICWRSEGYTAHSYPYSLQLVGDNDVRPATRNSYHGLGSYPLTLWKMGEEFCDPTSLSISGPVERPRAYKLLVSMVDFTDVLKPGGPLPVVDAAGRQVYPVLTRVRLAPRGPLPVVTPTVVIGDFAGLAGTRIEILARPGAGVVLSVTVHWVARSATPLDAKVFMHVLDQSGAVIAQSDHQPDAGWFPTNYWQTGDVVEDHFEITLPQDALVNDLRFGLGMYDSQSVQRLPAIDLSTGERVREDIVFVRR